jgi:hypothetical protein
MNDTNEFRNLIDIVESIDSRPQYRVGLCDAFAIALHQLTKLPLGAWVGEYYDDFTEETELEYAHLCVVVSFENKTWIDVDGLHNELPKNIHFDNQIESIKLIAVTENDAREIFTVEDLDDDIETAKDFIRSDMLMRQVINQL